MNALLSPRLQAAGLFLTVLLLVTSASAADQATVEGKFLGDGKDGNIRYVFVETREPFSDKPAISITFTEKDPSSSKRPSFDAGFKKLGSALLLSVFRDGDIFGCEVAHSAHEKSPFSSLGVIKIEDFKVEGDRVSGRVTTGGELDSFDQKWSVDLVFSAPLPPGAFAGAPEPAPAPAEAAEAAAPSGPAPSASQLPLPESAQDVQIKALVGQMAFRSTAPVADLAKDFAGRLEKAGWKDEGGRLVTKNNAMMRFARDGASLTVMVKPDAAGSAVTIMSQGMDWADSTDSGAAGSGTPADPEAEADRLIKDALKQIPGF
jgi:hypothetical protein